MTKFPKLFIALALAVVAVGVFFVAPIVKAADDTNLILHWDLNEGSGTTALDDSGNSYDGTLYNDPVYVPGHEGTGVELNGIYQFIQTPTPFDFLGTPDQPYALSAWVKLPATGASGNIFHISSNDGGDGWCIPFLTLTAGHFVATGWDTNGMVSATDPAVATSGEWHQVISTWDAENGLRLFVNGVLVATTPQADYAASGSSMYASLGLGNAACSNDQGYLVGTVDDARIYSRALVADDIETIATEGAAAAPPDLEIPLADEPFVPAAPNTGVKSERPITLIVIGGLGFIAFSYGVYRVVRKLKN